MTDRGICFQDGSFDDDWRAMRFDDSVQRFDRELERCRRDMLRLDGDAPHLEVGQLNYCSLLLSLITTHADLKTKLTRGEIYMSLLFK